MKAIIFDLDDTLYNEIDFVKGAFDEVCLYLSNKFNIEFNILKDETISILTKKGRGQIFNLLCQKFKLDEDISVLVEIYRKSSPNIKIYEDALYFLDKYNNKYKFGIITDGLNYVQHKKLDLLNIRDKLDEIVVTDDLGNEFWKPSKVPYINICKSLCVNFEDAIYVGDNPNKDFHAAKELGMKTIRIIRDEGSHINTFLDEYYESNHTIRDFYELETLLMNINF